MSFDLSAIDDDKLALILLRVPVKNLIKMCPQVSRQWNRILSDNHFWRQKMEQDGYELEWTKLVGLNTKSFKCIASRQCFGRNFIRDQHNIVMDPRWDGYTIIRHAAEGGDDVDEDSDGRAHIEIPPVFFDRKPKYESGAEFCGGPIMACQVTGRNSFVKRITIKLEDEGLTDDIMDNFRPTIIVSEMVANRRDSAANYLMNCALQVAEEDDHFRQPEAGAEQKSEHREFHVDPNGQWASATNTLHFNQWQAEEGWNRVEHQFKNYPAGMRYLSVMCVAFELRNTPVGHGCKLANCSVKAICENNAV